MSDRAEHVREIVQRGLWFEDFQDGVIYRHRPGRTVTEADNVLFTTLTMNTQSLHLDAHGPGSSRSGNGSSTPCSPWRQPWVYPSHN